MFYIAFATEDGYFPIKDSGFLGHYIWEARFYETEALARYFRNKLQKEWEARQEKRRKEGFETYPGMHHVRKSK